VEDYHTKGREGALFEAQGFIGILVFMLLHKNNIMFVILHNNVSALLYNKNAYLGPKESTQEISIQKGKDKKERSGETFETTKSFILYIRGATKYCVNRSA
jgi:hypothetical protein